jgi:phage replication-related protein YjqB (UPF0714/DUF867 family)
MTGAMETMNGAVKVVVVPLDGGWAVQCDGVCETTVFRAGGRAEAHARALAVALSRAGYHAHLIITDRRSLAIGACLSFAAGDPGEPAPRDLRAA